MAVILGSMTTVIIDGSTDGFQSVSWNTQVQNNKLWHVGNWLPWTTQVSIVETVNVTTYAGVLSPFNITPSTSCVNAPTKSVIINPASCVGNVVGVNGNLFVMSYSYNKSDPNGFGTETWSFQRWKDATSYSSGSPGSPNSVVGTKDPDFVLQGMAEGTWSADGMARYEVGIVGGTDGVASHQGNVSAGFPGQGSATEENTVTMAAGSAVGNGALTVPTGGGVGQSSITIPHQPIYT